MFCTSFLYNDTTQQHGILERTPLYVCKYFPKAGNTRHMIEYDWSTSTVCLLIVRACLAGKENLTRCPDTVAFLSMLHHLDDPVAEDADPPELPERLAAKSLFIREVSNSMFSPVQLHVVHSHCPSVLPLALPFSPIVSCCCSVLSFGLALQSWIWPCLSVLRLHLCWCLL